AVRSEAFLPALLAMLSERELRGAAREAFVACGEPALRFLEASLTDEALPHEIRRNLPRTISQFPPAQAAGVLQAQLLQERDGQVRYRMIRGLGRLATDNHDLKFDVRLLRKGIERTLEAAFRLAHWRSTLLAGAAAEQRRATPRHALLASLLLDKEQQNTERLFRLLGLVYRDEDFRNIHRGLRNSNAKVRASSRELLENTVRRPLRDPVLALVDDAPLEARLARARPYYEAATLDYQGLLSALLDQRSETLRALAAYHVGELGLTALRGRLESFDRRSTGFYFSHVVERALRMLE